VGIFLTKVAFITGITGQDGSYLTEFLLNKNYFIHGLIRRTSTFGTERLNEVYFRNLNNRDRISLHYGDLQDQSSINRLLEFIKPDEIYNLAAQSHVKVSFEIPNYTADIDALGTIRILEAIKTLGLKSSFYQASSSELYGNEKSPQNELTKFAPRSPYAISKLFAYWATVNYREAYGIKAVNGILFNHESPRRGLNFLTRKVTSTVAKIKLGQEEKLILGNLESIRDWGYAKEYVEAMWLMLQQENPKDYVVATGIGATVLEFVQEAFEYADLDWQKHVEIDQKYFRPTEVDQLVGDASLIRKDLGWKSLTSWKDLIKIMINADLKLFSN
jgi:GDPmannose 4,6-dehydratase